VAVCVQTIAKGPSPCHGAAIQRGDRAGAGEGNRTLVCSSGSGAVCRHDNDLPARPRLSDANRTNGVEEQAYQRWYKTVRRHRRRERGPPRRGVRASMPLHCVVSRTELHGKIRMSGRLRRLNFEGFSEHPEKRLERLNSFPVVGLIGHVASCGACGASSLRCAFTAEESIGTCAGSPSAEAKPWKMSAQTPLAAETIAILRRSPFGDRESQTHRQRSPLHGSGP
jgi:hypothetical protein